MSSLFAPPKPALLHSSSPGSGQYSQNCPPKNKLTDLISTPLQLETQRFNAKGVESLNLSPTLWVSGKRHGRRLKQTGEAASELNVSGAVLMLEHKSPRHIKVEGGVRENRVLEINGWAFASENEAFMCGKPCYGWTKRNDCNKFNAVFTAASNFCVWKSA